MDAIPLKYLKHIGQKKPVQFPRMILLQKSPRTMVFSLDRTQVVNHLEYQFQQSNT
jgi:hypothetical protein